MLAMSGLAKTRLESDSFISSERQRDDSPMTDHVSKRHGRARNGSPFFCRPYSTEDTRPESAFLRPFDQKAQSRPAPVRGEATAAAWTVADASGADRGCRHLERVVRIRRSFVPEEAMIVPKKPRL
jgi:hypothetical protein